MKKHCPCDQGKGFKCEFTLATGSGDRYVNSKGSEQAGDLEVKCNCWNKDLTTKSYRAGTFREVKPLHVKLIGIVALGEKGRHVNGLVNVLRAYDLTFADYKL